ncbi:MAG: hypothetical protein AAFY88_05635 [Acidobacteriota bacterium]
MIIWSGFGFLTLLILALSMIFMQVGVEAIWGEEAYKTLPWAQTAGIVLGGLVTFVLGSWLNRETRIVLDEASGDGLTIQDSNTLFFIKMEYWGLLFIIIALLLEFA